MANLFPVVCAWCGTATGVTSVPGSHGICPGCSREVRGVPRLSETELEALPFGVIELDGAGTVLGYSAAESALSGREPGSVIGKNFFLDVAPCTAVKEFQGRFRSFVELKSEPESFDFIFSFPNRTAHVAILFVGSGSGTAFVLVRSRTSVAPGT